MTYGTLVMVCILLQIFHLLTILFIRSTSKGIFGPKVDLRESMRRLAQARPRASKVYKASFALVLVEFVVIVLGKLLGGN